MQVVHFKGARYYQLHKTHQHIHHTSHHQTIFTNFFLNHLQGNESMKKQTYSQQLPAVFKGESQCQQTIDKSRESASQFQKLFKEKHKRSANAPNAPPRSLPATVK